ncbi:hypothetical protein LU196_14030 [Pantoea sp. Mb-10]|uniref:hypothetical protein n=1 Tax=unclassified Pantoea TaxID=2630326 RepID=UPI001E4E93C1|nr:MULTISPECIES: hypothetical protein [unclassified Pantoea]MCE0491162.1 hypothetical protein [Pantoea sp. Mb-10]MCE0502651.1 hypothetical protein [Pantoea sp. Pb-8]
MSKYKNVNELYFLRSGLNSLSVLIDKKTDFEKLSIEQLADKKAVAEKEQYYAITEPDDIDFDAEWVFIDTLKEKYTVLPDIEL